MVLVDILGWGGLVVVIIFVASGVRIVRPIEVGLIETLGKYSKTATQGFTWIIPVIQTMHKVNMTERMVDTEEQYVITKDNLNARLDAVVYYQIQDAKMSQYNVDNHKIQLTSLARTTLRAVVGKMTLTDANENRAKINTDVEQVLNKETKSYGVNVLRVELQRIEPPRDVQEAMNEVAKAERKKIAATDFANATEIEADGMRRAAIKKADGARQAQILQAEGKAKSIELENVAWQEYFKGNAVVAKQLDVTQASLAQNSKVLLTQKGIDPVIVLGEDKFVPLKNKRSKKNE